MSTLKTVTSALTAAVLVTGIGIAVAQTDDSSQTASADASTVTTMPSEQTPADPNAMPAQTPAQQPTDDPAKMNPAVDTTAAPATTTETTPSAYDEPATPAPRADRH